MQCVSLQLLRKVEKTGKFKKGSLWHGSFRQSEKVQSTLRAPSSSEPGQRSHIPSGYFSPACENTLRHFLDTKGSRHREREREIAVGRGNATWNRTTRGPRGKYCIMDGTYRGLPVTVPFRSTAHRHQGTFKVICWRWIYDRDGYAVNPGTWEAKDSTKFKDNPQNQQLRARLAIMPTPDRDGRGPLQADS